MIKERIPISGDLKSKVKQLMEYADGTKAAVWIFPLRRSITPIMASQ